MFKNCISNFNAFQMDYLEKKQVRRVLKFEHPFTMLVAGPTGSGKTVLIRQIIEHNRHTINNLEGNPKVLWCYGIYQKIYDVPIPNVNIEYYEGLPLEEYLKKYKYDIVVIDDLMTDIKKDGEVEKLYTRCSHHAGISMIFTVQNLFKNYIRTISLNCHYIILTKTLEIRVRLTILDSKFLERESYHLYVKHTKTQQIPDTAT